MKEKSKTFKKIYLAGKQAVTAMQNTNLLSSATQMAKLSKPRSTIAR
jgi:hypothetical protein